MACKRCGGVKTVVTVPNLRIYELTGNGQRTVCIAAKAPLLLRGLPEGDVTLGSGKTIKLSEADAAKLTNEDAPIWKIS